VGANNDESKKGGRKGRESTSNPYVVTCPIQLSAVVAPMGHMGLCIRPDVSLTVMYGRATTRCPRVYWPIHQYTVGGRSFDSDEMRRIIVLKVLTSLRHCDSFSFS